MTKKNQVEPSSEDYNSWYVGEKENAGETLLLEKEIEEYERKQKELTWENASRYVKNMCFDLSICFGKREW